MADDAQKCGSEIYQLLKKIGEVRTTYRSLDEINEVAARSNLRLRRTDLDCQLSIFKATPQSHPGDSGYVVDDGPYIGRGVDLKVDLSHRALAQVSKDYKPIDRISLHWKKVDSEVLELIDARLLSSKRL